MDISSFFSVPGPGNPRFTGLKKNIHSFSKGFKPSFFHGFLGDSRLLVPPFFWVVVSNIVQFPPLFGEDSHCDEHSFQRGASTTNIILYGKFAQERYGNLFIYIYIFKYLDN